MRGKGAAAVGLAGSLVLGAMPFAEAPAYAATSCSVRYDQWSGIASGSCSGTGYMRFGVKCNAVIPFAGWRYYSDWIYVPGGLNSAWTFPNCPPPAGYVVWADYS